jgi:ATP-dependent phosphoenolpyruvate carboxykinase
VPTSDIETRGRPARRTTKGRDHVYPSTAPLTVGDVHHNLPASSLYEQAIRYEKDSSIAENGALAAYSGVKTGRSPKDKRVVKHPDSEQDVWWGTVNVPCDAQTFAINRQRALDYLNTRERLYCFDGFAGWDPKYRIKIRVICSRAYHALFMHTMLIRSTRDELATLTGKRISLKHTRAIDAIHDGTLANVKTERDPIFGFDVATECPGVPREIVRPRAVWTDASAYDTTAKKLAGLFRENFRTYESGVSAEIKGAGPS